MGRTPPGLNRGPWTREEDLRLRNYIEAHGEGGWRIIPKKAGLLRCGKSCRLRWMNYLRPDVKCGHILPEEEDLILRLHRLLGNRWALIAGRIPGRTDNEIKNYWNTHLSKKLISQGLDPRTHKHLSDSEYKALNPGDRKISQKSQKENKTTTPTRNIAESRSADLQAAPSEGGAAIAAHGNENDREATKWPANNVNQLLGTSKTCNPQPASVAVNGSPQISGISSTSCPFQKGTSNNNNMGSKQIPYPPLTPTCFDSLALRGIGRYDLDQYLMKNPVTSSNDMITSTLRLSSGLQAASFVGQFDSNHAFISANALPYNEKHQIPLQASDVPASCAVSNEVTAVSYPYHTSPTSMAATLADFNSEIFHVLLESVVNEELQFQEPSSHTSIEQNVQLGPLSQPEAANLTDDFWSMLSPNSQYYPSGFHK